MSDEIYTADALTVSRYCGPARDDGGDRRRFQFYVSDWDQGATTTLSLEEVEGLVLAIASEVPEIGRMFL